MDILLNHWTTLVVLYSTKQKHFFANIDCSVWDSLTKSNVPPMPTHTSGNYVNTIVSKVQK